MRRIFAQRDRTGFRLFGNLRQLALFFLAALLACDAPVGPPIGEVLIWVDTDTSVPKFANRLRIDAYAATAFCQWAGGDLPLEVQWEYAAAAAGRVDRTPYPWGEGDPNDVQPPADLVYRRDVVSFGSCGVGPLPVTAADHDGGDVTPLGIVDLGGNATELAREGFAR